jgi:hypothetical protein
MGLLRSDAMIRATRIVLGDSSVFLAVLEKYDNPVVWSGKDAPNRKRRRHDRDDYGLTRLR